MSGGLVSPRTWCLLAFAWAVPLISSATVHAQDKARIGVLLPELGRAQLQSLKGIQEELKRLGYVERKNLLRDSRNAKGDRSALRPAADELVKLKVAAIFTTGTRATLAAAAPALRFPSSLFILAIRRRRA